MGSLVWFQGADSDVEVALELLDTVEELKTKMTMAQANAMLTSFRAETAAGSKSVDAAAPENDRGTLAVNQKLRVCDVCGAFLSIFDSDRRLADHFGGKLHLGYLQIRRKIAEIADARRERRRGRNGDAAADVLDTPVHDEGGKGETRKKQPAGVKRERRDRHSRSRSRPRCVRCSRSVWRRRLGVSVVLCTDWCLPSACCRGWREAETTARVPRRRRIDALATARTADAAAGAREAAVRVADGAGVRVGVGGDVAVEEGRGAWTLHSQAPTRKRDLVWSGICNLQE